MSDKVAVIGAGIFGCNIALAVASDGNEVVLFERLQNIIMGTSNNNTNRIHQGFHYPRDWKTAIECRDNHRRFEKEFKRSIFDIYPNVYCLADEGSLTNKEEFIEFCNNLLLQYQTIDLSKIGVEIKGCSFGINCQEAMIDVPELRIEILSRIVDDKRIKLECNADVISIKKSGVKFELMGRLFDTVINCSYANINMVTEQLGHELKENQFEYTVMPIVSLPLPPLGITIMDGPFMTLLPYNKTGKFLLYHVNHSVIKTEISKTLDLNWLDPEKDPLSEINEEEYFRDMVISCSRFIPIIEKAKLEGFLEAPRMVLPKHEQDDARPSFVTNYGDGYYTVFSGKIDRSLSIADQVCREIKKGKE